MGNQFKTLQITPQFIASTYLRLIHLSTASCPRQQPFAAASFPSVLHLTSLIVSIYRLLPTSIKAVAISNLTSLLPSIFYDKLTQSPPWPVEATRDPKQALSAQFTEEEGAATLTSSPPFLQFI